ncbi:FMNH2-dependent monooxygenase [Meredithblackwellia eburnea MCA 4105]
MTVALTQTIAPSSFESLKISTKSKEEISAPKFDRDPKTAEEFIARAKEVASILAVDVHERDARDEIPYKQVQLLKDAGLVTALGPTKYGGGGQSFATGYKIQRAVAAGDGSIGQVLAYHYLWSYTAKVVGTPEQIEFEARRYTEGKLLFGGAVNPRDSDLVITEKDDKTLSFTGKKAFSTGSKISDLTVLEGVLQGTETHVFAIVPSRQEGIRYQDNWTGVLGMRGTQSGAVDIVNVEVGWERALGFVNKEFQPLGAFNTLLLPAIQLHFVNFYLGIAEGALAKASQYTVNNTRPWPFAGKANIQEHATDEFYLQEIYGTLQAKVWAVEAQVNSAGDILGPLIDREDRLSVTAQERGEAAVRIAAAKVTSTEVGLEVTSRIYEVLGARSIAFKAGFDHFWRNLRTHTLHDPVAHKKAEVGRFVLTGELATPTWYT